ncbi:MAG: methyl-accepting chemotaxis protein [Candidatus Omnitrophota bacterium]
MLKDNPANRRRNYFIKKRFQLNFIVKFCLILAAACFVMGLSVYFLSTRTVTASFENLRLVAKSTADFILPTLALSSLAAVILTSLACIIAVMFISHRIAGPLYHLEKSLERIVKGDLTVHTRLRENDEIKVLAEGLNEAVKQLREKVANSQEELKDLAVQLHRAKEKLATSGVSHTEIDALLNPCEENLKKAKQSLSCFKVK